MVLEGLTTAHELLAGEGMLFGVVVHGTYAGDPGTIPVFAGEAPAAATTYLAGGDGKVVLETFGMPPVHIVRALCHPAAERVQE